MRPAARILLAEAAALRPILDRTPPGHLDRPTVCTGWSVRDVLAHCAAALTHVAQGSVHRFTPDDNQADVDARRGLPIGTVIEELFAGYGAAAVAIDAAGGRLDGVGVGEWIHGGDVREALGEPDAYVSAGVELALPLLLDRSRRQEAPGIAVVVDGRSHAFGVGETGASLATDLETFVRLTGGRRPDPARSRLVGCTAADLVLFS